MQRPPCTHCGHPESTVYSTSRLRCRACEKTFPRSGKYVRPPQDRLPAEQCPKCGNVASPIKCGTEKGRPRSECAHCGHRWRRGMHVTEEVPFIDGDFDTFVWSCAVNDTPVFLPFLRALEGFVAANTARLGIIPIRYKNPTSRREDEQPITYAKHVLPYLVDRRVKLCRGLQVLADIKTQPTAVNPLASMDGLTGTDSCIIGHPRIALRSVATRGHELPKLMLSTGAVTRPNYSQTFAGSRGAFNHVHGAVVVQIDRRRGIFHMRHINATSSGSFIDLDREYLPDGTNRPAAPAQALVLGDGHAEKADPQAVAASREQQALLRPRRLVWHDVHNHGSASHHNGTWERFLRRVTGTDKVLDELRTTAALIDSFHRAGQETVVVSSNHHDHLGRWLADSRNGDDVVNAALYHKAKADVLAAIETRRQVPDIFALVVRPLLEHPARFLTERDSYQVAGIELAYHGDKGPNGSRGSAKSLNKIGVKSVIGHSHSPCIEGGCYQTGTLSVLDMGYNTGPSSWLHSNVVIYANGKRTHLHIIGGHWRIDRAPAGGVRTVKHGGRRNGRGSDSRQGSARAGRQARGAARAGAGRGAARAVRRVDPPGRGGSRHASRDRRDVR